MPNIEYNNYRLRMVNNAQDASGNDFAIDDIAVYMHKPGLMSYQTNINCSERNQENAGETVMPSVDPFKIASIPEVNGVKNIYYQFQKMDGTHIVIPEYWVATAD